LVGVPAYAESAGDAECDHHLLLSAVMSVNLDNSRWW
jgi:hypothetical protein